MVSNSALIRTIADKLKKYKPKNIVLDPVMVSNKRVKTFLEEEASASLINILMPLADIITPNIPEAEVLSSMKISKSEDMVEAAKSYKR